MRVKLPSCAAAITASNRRDRNVPRQQPIEDTPFKALYALVIVVSSFAVSAQALADSPQL
jgi:hypothetical protein